MLKSEFFDCSAPGEATALLAVSQSCIDFDMQEAFQAALQAQLPTFDL